VEEPSFRRTVAFLAPLLALPLAAITLVSAAVKAKPNVVWLRVIGEGLPWTVLFLGLGVCLFELCFAQARAAIRARRRRRLFAELSGVRRRSAKAVRAAALAAERQTAYSGHAAIWALAAIAISMFTLIVSDAALRGAVDLMLVIAFVWAYAVWARRRRCAMLKTCPDCAERVKAAARVCRHCGFRFNAASSPGAQVRPDAVRLLAVTPEVLNRHRLIVDEFRAAGHTSVADWLAACDGVEDLRVLHAMLGHVTKWRFEGEQEEKARQARVVEALIALYEDDDIDHFRALALARERPEPPS
jgi:hypothetical protein